MNEQERIIEKLAKIEAITTQYSENIKDESDLLQQECAIIPAEKLREEFERIAGEGRLLNIGIIGRVKAGKSSLLNSVFFNGESILPKAATPMTASLTVMTHGDHFSATVEYYSAGDIDEIKRLHDDYKKLWEPKFNEHKKRIEDKAKKNQENLSVSEIEAKAKRRASEEIKNERLSASFDHYRLMQPSGKIDAMRSRTTIEETIQAENIDDLMGQLNQYVGSGGQLMPFTRNAIIRLPLDSLRDIQVVDTPGINDPVASRTERTNDYLKQCDVVFIVSPSGQFASKEDTNLMDRLSSKEGVRELYFVASQVDNQLYGSPGEEAGWDLHKALNAIRSDLSGHMADTLTGMKQSNPEVGNLFDQLVNEGQDRVIVSSAMCHAMSLRFDDRANWDNDMNHVWNSLKEHYPDYFGSDSSAKENLEKLSGVNTVSAKIADARSKKDAIIAQKQEDYLADKAKNTEDFREKLKDAVKGKIETLNSTDITTVQEQIKNLKKLEHKLTEAIDGTFEDCVDEFRITLRETIGQASKKLFAETDGKVNDAEGSVTKTRTWTTGWWLWKKEHHENYEVTTIRAGAVRDSLNELIVNLQEDFNNSFDSEKQKWKKSVQQQISNALDKAIEDVDLIEFDMVKTALRRLVNKIELPELDLSSHTFHGSQTGTLEQNEAEKFIDEVRAWLVDLRGFYSKETGNIIKEMEKSAKQEQASALVLGDISKQQETLENELKNKHATLDRLKKCQKSLEAAE
jgi:tRNA U34 5-carboxymethylaminomethyl modifying GTPase MnmE/TrmE